MKIKRLLLTTIFACLFVVGCTFGKPSSSSSSSSTPSSTSTPTSEVSSSTSSSSTSDLSAEKTSAINELNAYFDTFKESDYTTENWQTLTGYLNTAISNINKSASVEAIYSVVTAAKVNMASVEKLPDLTAKKAMAVDELNSYYQTFDQADYSETNWATLTYYFNAGIDNINNATTEEAITSALETAKSNMASVEVSVDLTSDKEAATTELTNHYQTFVASQYTTANYLVLTGIYETAKTDVNAATSKTEIATIISEAKTAMNEVAKKPAAGETLEVIGYEFYNLHYLRLITNQYVELLKTGQQGFAVTSSTLETAKYFEGPYMWGANENATVTIQALNYDLTKVEATFFVRFTFTNDTTQDLAIVIANGQVQGLDFVKGKAKAEIDAYLVTKGYIEDKYTPENWALLLETVANGKADIDAATNYYEVMNQLPLIKASLDAIDQKGLSLDEVKAIAVAELNALAGTKVEAEYSTENWILLQLKVTEGIASINAAVDETGVETALTNAKNAINSVTKKAQPLNITTWNPHGAIFIQFGWSNSFTNAQITTKTAYVKDLHTGVITQGIFNHTDGDKAIFFRFDGYTVDGSGTNEYEIVITIVVGSDAYEFRSECKAGVRINLATEKTKAIVSLQGYPDSKGYVESRYTPENWILVQTHITNGITAISNASNYLELTNALNAAKAAIDAVEQKPLAIDEAKTLAINELAALVGSKNEADYTPENWQALQTALTNGITAITNATTEEAVATALNDAKVAINSIAKNTLPLNTAGAPWNPHGVSHIVVGWTNAFNNADVDTYSASIKDLKTGTIYTGTVLHNDGDKAKFFFFNGYNVEAADCEYEFTIRITLKSGEVYTATFNVNGRTKEAGH
jgi:hypothetical protein